MNTSNMRIALVCMKHLYVDPRAPEKRKQGDIEANLARHEYWIEKALAHDPDFIGFPEFSLTGWIVDPKHALTLRSAPVRAFEAWARKRRVFMATSFVERKGQTLHNTCLIAGPRGRVGVMRKINLIHREAKVYAPGRAFPVFQIGPCRMGVTTCADSSYYEMHRILSLRGAEVIFAPSANSIARFGNNRAGWVRWRRQTWTPAAKGACVTIAGMSCAGLFAPKRKQDEEYKFCSGALVLDWTGSVQAQRGGQGKAETMLVTDLDLKGLRRARTEFLRDSFRPNIVYNRKHGWKGGLLQ